MPDVTDPQIPQPAAATDTESLIDVLLHEGLLTEEEYQDVKVKSATEGKAPIEIIKQEGFVDEAKIAEAQAKMLGIPYISLSTVSFSPEAINLLPRAVVERFSLIPFLYEADSKTLSIAMANPVDMDALAFVQ